MAMHGRILNLMRHHVLLDDPVKELRPDNKPVDRGRKLQGTSMAQQSTSEFDQVSLKKGIEQFGDQAHDAVEKEVLQLHELDVMYPIHATYEDKKAALNYLMFIKKK